MPLLLGRRAALKDAVPKKDDVRHPSVVFTIDHPDRPNVKTVVIEEPPRKRTIRVRHNFYAGPYTEYYVWKPFSYLLFRGEVTGKTLLAGLFFANERLESLDQEGVCAAPIPNVDYGRDHGIGICLWVNGKNFGDDVETAAVKCHEYFWTSDFNTAVSFYEDGRPKEICSTSGWLTSMEKWQKLTAEGKAVTWIPIRARDTKQPVKTLRDAWNWLSREKDFNYR